MGGDGGASSGVGPVHRAFSLLQLVVEADGPVGVRDLARRSGLSKSTTGRTLGILADLGMVERTDHGAAVPGAALAALAGSADQSGAVLRERYRPLAERLMRQFGENAAVAVDDGEQLLYVASARIDSAVQVPDPVEQRFDFHVVAPGLIAMADWSASRLDAYLDGALSQPTPHSVVDPATIRARLAAARSDGFVWTDQELDLEVNGVAVPVRDLDGHLVAVATIYGPTYRLNPAGSPTLGAALIAAVNSTEVTPA